MIIVALPKIEDAKRVRRVLLSHGYDNVVPCGTGAAALMEANNENRGLIICAARLPDMHYSELLEYMPRFYELLLLGSGSAVSDAGGDVMALTMPRTAGIKKRRKRNRRRGMSGMRIISATPSIS